jgi:hypothetical protein
MPAVRHHARPHLQATTGAAMSPRQRHPRDFAGQNRRANERARALGYRGKDDAYKRRREGLPTPADIKAGGADWTKLPGGKLWVRVDFTNAKKHLKADRLVAALLPTLPIGATVAVLVRFDDGSYRQLTSATGVPVSELAGGLALLVSDLLDQQGGTGGTGTGAPKKIDTPLTAQKVQEISGQLEEDADSSMFDLVEEVQLTITPPAAGVQGEF